jgi:DNA processing protein
LRTKAAAAVVRAGDRGITSIPFESPQYPAALATIADPPPVFWVRGDPTTLDRPAVALVGSRAGSSYAVAVAERLAADLASRGLVVVSGLARGVDSAAHRGALSVQGLTVGVLGSGADVVYPNEHRGLATEICAAGAIVSELVPGTAPRAEYFPARNRIISGLARAVVVIEAGEKSGSLITARLALEQGRDVLAVPGNVLNGRNRGGHALIRDGARLVESADDVMEEIQAAAADLRPVQRHAEDASLADPILDALEAGDAIDVDELASRTGLGAARILPRLASLELMGLVRRAGAGRFLKC